MSAIPNLIDQNIQAPSLGQIWRELLQGVEDLRRCHRRYGRASWLGEGGEREKGVRETDIVVEGWYEEREGE